MCRRPTRITGAKHGHGLQAGAHPSAAIAAPAVTWVPAPTPARTTRRMSRGCPPIAPATRACATALICSTPQRWTARGRTGARARRYVPARTRRPHGSLLVEPTQPMMRPTDDRQGARSLPPAMAQCERCSWTARRAQSMRACSRWTILPRPPRCRSTGADGGDRTGTRPEPPHGGANLAVAVPGGLAARAAIQGLWSRRASVHVRLSVVKRAARRSAQTTSRCGSPARSPLPNRPAHRGVGVSPRSTHGETCLRSRHGWPPRAGRSGAPDPRQD